MSENDQPVLVLETVRLRGLRGQYVVPEGCELSVNEITSSLDGTIHSTGKEVEQPETARIGVERLVLVGGSIQERQFAKFQPKLDAWSEQTDQIIREAESGNVNSHGIPTSTTLRIWNNKLNQSITSPSKVKAQAKGFGRWIFMLSIVAVFIFGFWLMRSQIPLPNFQQGKPFSPKESFHIEWAKAVGLDEQASPQDVISRLEKLFEATDQSSDASDPEESKKDLNAVLEKLQCLRLSKLPGQLKQDDLINESPLRDDYVKKLFERGKVDPYAVVDSDLGEFRDIVENPPDVIADRLLLLRNRINEVYDVAVNQTDLKARIESSEDKSTNQFLYDLLLALQAQDMRNYVEFSRWKPRFVTKDDIEVVMRLRATLKSHRFQLGKKDPYQPPRKFLFDGYADESFSPNNELDRLLIRFCKSLNNINEFALQSESE